MSDQGRSTEDRTDTDAGPTGETAEDRADANRGVSGQGNDGNAETKKTVLAAGAANVFIAVIKIIAGVLSGSSAMLAEAAHSVADTLNQVFLFTSLRRSTRPPDSGHPFGYGQERYFWSLLAAVGILMAGGGFSVFEGILAIVSGGGSGSASIAYIVLAISVVAEGSSLVRAIYQLQKEAKGADRGFFEHVRRSRDMTVKAALYEDTAAVVGLVFAAVGLFLRELTGSEVYDGAASIAIGLLLVWVAYKLGQENKAMLIGQSVEPEVRDEIERLIRGADGVDDVEQLLTMHFGPDELLIAARVSFTDDISADQAEEVATRVDQLLQAELPIVRHVFLDPTERASLRR